MYLLEDILISDSPNPTCISENHSITTLAVTYVYGMLWYSIPLACVNKVSTVSIVLLLMSLRM